ncbi:MAG TPA: VCBS repeat-containing protein [Steroidobacteraceae bacterium]|nr:VCBS repeat-containing protein [Steroidobacteraceae bacterium]
MSHSTAHRTNTVQSHGAPVSALPLRGRRSLGWWVLGAAIVALPGCYDDCGSCASPPPPPATEVSLGLVAGNFNANGHTSIIATNTVVYGWVNSGNLEIYLSTGSGTFASPVLQADGNDPLYLASADLNGDDLPDVVSASYNDGALAVFLNNPQSPGQLFGRHSRAVLG